MRDIFSFSVALIALFVACTSTKTVVKEYKGVESIDFITDSVEASGTVLSPFRVVVFDIEDGTKDSTEVCTLYKDGKATGSIQVRGSEGSYDVKIIDVVEEK